MRTVWLVIFFLLWTWWADRYVINAADSDKVYLDLPKQQEYLMHGKPALPLVEAINESITKKEIPSNVVIYGLGMEKYRFIANFKLIGGLYGWASHQDFMKAVHEGGAKGLHEWLKQYNVSYLAVDGITADANAYVVEMKLPTDDPEWGTYFTSIVEVGRNSLYQLK